ncbi:MAG TPA: M20 family metallo-hydrolase [Bacillota bacterium]|nr:M20 family metallo-hydrolase [Bacillota bacterium]
MKISGERLLSDLEKLKGFTDTPGEGVTRFSYGENDGKVREYIREAAESQGFSVRTDPVGNMYICLSEGKNDSTVDIVGKTKKIRIGSHIDTVRNGGWLDGIYGVASSLEVLRTLAENDSQRLSEVEVVIFAEEEGSNFGSTMTGSKFIAGIYGERDLDRLKNDTNVPLREMLKNCEFPAYRREDVTWDFSDVKAMLELHIEQGPVLEREGKSIGIVDAIFGMTTMEVTVLGVGNHAGATPMRYRQDALAAAAECIGEAERVARADREGILVATVGKVAVSPNCSNVIPEKVVFTVEAREKREERITGAIEEIKAAIAKVAERRGVSFEIRVLAESKPFHLDGRIIALMDRLAAEAGIRHQIMDSGAVHDTCVIAPHTPSGMLFVPSIGGRSHVPFEDTAPGDLVTGAQLLLDAVLNV